MGPLDVTLTATRRPDLLDLTLRSFKQNLLNRTGTGTLYLNIDPLWGDDADDERVERVARYHFDRVVIRRPDAASYGAAVKWLWAIVESEWFLHLEDDWLLRWKVSIPKLDAHLRAPTWAN